MLTSFLPANPRPSSTARTSHRLPQRYLCHRCQVSTNPNPFHSSLSRRSHPHRPSPEGRYRIPRAAHCSARNRCRGDGSRTAQGVRGVRLLIAAATCARHHRHHRHERPVRPTRRSNLRSNLRNLRRLAGHVLCPWVCGAPPPELSPSRKAASSTGNKWALSVPSSCGTGAEIAVGVQLASSL